MRFMEASLAVVRVGKGRGFIVGGNDDSRYIVTAAHCLPKLPEPNSSSLFPRLLGQLRAKRTTIWADCLFADPVSDMSVLCTPDDATRWKEYSGFVNDI